MGTKANHLAQAMRARARAEECRKLSRAIMDRRSASQYLDLANAYEWLASSEEALAEQVSPVGFSRSPDGLTPD